LNDVELDVLAFLQCFEPIPLKSGIMDEHVLSALESDEPETLPVVEPLDGTLASHTILLS
jgi:hypothetical protein